MSRWYPDDRTRVLKLAAHLAAYDEDDDLLRDSAAAIRDLADRIKEMEARLNLKVSLPVLTSRMISDWAGRWPLIEKNSDRWWDWTQEAVDFACLLSTPEEED